jgi:prolipoprotein diacylglyceryltransferase
VFAALLVKLIRLTPTAGELLDAAAPGMALCLALIRLSSLFNTNCRGRIVITDKLFQHLPYAISWTDAAGNVEYRLATFFLEFIALLVIMVILCAFFFRHRSEPLWDGWRNQGNVMWLFLVLLGLVEFIADSTRYDSALMHFFLIKRLNPYASFISIAQVFSGVCILLVFIHYMRISVKTNGWRWFHFLAILLFVASLVGAGYMGEYRVQRTALYVNCYLWQGGSLILLAATVIAIYRSCVAKDYDYEEE